MHSPGGAAPHTERQGASRSQSSGAEDYYCVPRRRRDRLLSPSYEKNTLAATRFMSIMEAIASRADIIMSYVKTLLIAVTKRRTTIQLHERITSALRCAALHCCPPYVLVPSCSALYDLVYRRPVATNAEHIPIYNVDISTCPNVTSSL